MNWGKSIIVAFILFATFIGALVTICVRQDISLANVEYYKNEGVYQQRLAATENTRALPAQPDIEIVERYLLKVSFDEFHRIEEAQLVLFSPSSADRDRKFALDATDRTFQLFDVSTVSRGVYRAQMSWMMDGRPYYFEKVVNR